MLEVADTTVILIAGKTESGKGTVVEHLEHLFKHTNPTKFNVIRCSLSTYIRETLKNDFYWDGEDTPESRKAMAEMYRIGTEFYPYHMARRVWERDILPNLGRVKKNVILVESFREKVNYTYFNNLRMEKQIKDLFTLRVNRPEHESTQKLTNHVSEIDLDIWNFDYNIQNNSTIEELKEKVLVSYLYFLHFINK